MEEKSIYVRSERSTISWYNENERTDGKKSATIGAYALPGQRSQVLTDFRDNFLPLWEAKYNDVSWSFSGEAEGEDQFLLKYDFYHLSLSYNVCSFIHCL